MANFLVAFIQYGFAPPCYATSEPRGLSPAEDMPSQMSLLLTPDRDDAPEGEDRALQLKAAIVTKGLKSL
jgi:hypothetical protein